MRAALALILLAACAATDVTGTYQGVLPAANGGGERRVRVTLKPDGFAAVSSAFSARRSRFLAEGTWRNEEGRIRLDLADQKSMAFRHSGDLLFSQDWDRAEWGEAGPGTLQRVR